MTLNVNRLPEPKHSPAFEAALIALREATDGRGLKVNLVGGFEPRAFKNAIHSLSEGWVIGFDGPEGANTRKAEEARARNVVLLANAWLESIKAGNEIF